MPRKKPRRKPEPEEPKRLVALVADTEVENTRVVSATLLKAGFTPVAGNSGRDTIALIVEHHPDVVFIDFVMMEGIKDELKSALSGLGLPAIPIILTGTGETCSHLNGRGWHIIARISDSGMTQSNVVYWATLAGRREWCS
jgi:CheY-like chemotaxis protein